MLHLAQTEPVDSSRAVLLGPASSSDIAGDVTSTSRKPTGYVQYGPKPDNVCRSKPSIVVTDVRPDEQLEGQVGGDHNTWMKPDHN